MGRRSKKKGKEQARKPDDRSIKTRLFLCLRNFAWEIKLDLELADRGLKRGAWTLHWDGKGILSLKMGLKLG